MAQLPAGGRVSVDAVQLPVAIGIAVGVALSIVALFVILGIGLAS